MDTVDPFTRGKVAATMERVRTLQFLLYKIH